MASDHPSFRRWLPPIIFRVDQASQIDGGVCRPDRPMRVTQHVCLLSLLLHDDAEIQWPSCHLGIERYLSQK